MVFFPRMYEDELLYSVIARYHKRSGNLTYSQTIEDIFGDKIVTPSVYLQSNINKIIDNIPNYFNITPKQLIYNHTLYPYYTAFMNKSDSEKVYSLMCEANSGGVYAKCGLSAKGSEDNYFKFCPKCMEEDIEKYGEPYWHRTHQIPEYMVCSKHKVLLQNSDVKISRYNRYELVTASTHNCKTKTNEMTFLNKTFNVLLRLSCNIEELLNLDYRREHSWFKENYHNYLVALNLSSISGVKRLKLLCTEFENHFGQELLSIFNLNIDKCNTRNWIEKLLSKEHVNVPIKNLLMIDYLGTDIIDIFNNIYRYKPFGEGPWPCMNKSEEHYGENLIEDVSIRYNNRRKNIEGIFRCNCGFEYKVRYYKSKNIDECRSNLNKISKSKDFQEIIQRLEYSSYIIDEELGKIELIIEKKESMEYRNKLKEKLRKKHRQIWVNYVKDHPRYCKGQIVKECHSTADWLYKYDREWMDNHSPNKNNSNNVNDYNVRRIDWKKRDDEILEEIKKIVEEIKNQDIPQRVTKSRIGKLYGKQLLILTKLDKLPKTKKFIENNSESIQDFRIRKVRWKIKDLIRKGETITLRKILGKMKLTPSEKDEIRTIIEGEILKYDKNKSM